MRKVLGHGKMEMPRELFSRFFNVFSIDQHIAFSIEKSIFQLMNTLRLRKKKILRQLKIRFWVDFGIFFFFFEHFLGNFREICKVFGHAFFLIFPKKWNQNRYIFWKNESVFANQAWTFFAFLSVIFKKDDAFLEIIFIKIN